MTTQTWTEEEHQCTCQNGWGKFMRHLPYKGAIGNQGKLGAGLPVFPTEKHVNWLSGAKWSALKTYIQVTLLEPNWGNLGIYVYIQVCMQ